MTALQQIIEHHYAVMDGPTDADVYHGREGTDSACILTVTNQADAFRIVAGFREYIFGKTVVEIGAGVGALSVEMARSAAKVWAIENDPAWTYAFVKCLYKSKPTNLHWIFAPADEIPITADVAVIRTCSGARSMLASARKKAPLIVFSVWDECHVAESEDPFLDTIANYLDQRRERIMAGAEQKT